ncbi:MAG: hypothetical protein NTZ09_20250, partial [Candidatus Hydrogenedentes bacterium]|nr:hypothetical protein [Candidatus Hydrogenedentota bacterium]
MSMKLRSFHNQLVTDFAPHHQQYHLAPLNIIQHPEVADRQFKLRKRIGTELFDGLRGCCRLMDKTSLDRRFQQTLLACRQS